MNELLFLSCRMATHLQIHHLVQCIHSHDSFIASPCYGFSGTNGLEIILLAKYSNIETKSNHCNSVFPNNTPHQPVMSLVRHRVVRMFATFRGHCWAFSLYITTFYTLCRINWYFENAHMFCSFVANRICPQTVDSCKRRTYLLRY